MGGNRGLILILIVLVSCSTEENRQESKNEECLGDFSTTGIFGRQPRNDTGRMGLRRVSRICPLWLF